MRLKMSLILMLPVLIAGNVFATENQPPAQGTAVPFEYKVGVNDVLTVAVLQPDPLSVELTVSPDGSISFPYIGSVQVANLTPAQIQDKIQTALRDYMKYPVVSVSLKEAKSRTFFVYGEVTRPGAYPLNQETSLVQAITTAGGFTRVASTNNIKILRQNPDASGSNSLTVDVSAIMSGKKQDSEKIHSGDVITVSQRFF